MKRYFDLIPLAARVNRRQSRMTQLCIILAVFLVTSIFGMADMEIRCQKQQTIQTDGAWHIRINQVSAEQAALLAQRLDVQATSRYGALNYGLDQGYCLQGVETAICGFDVQMLDLMPATAILEGRFPQSAQETVASNGVRQRLGLGLGDVVLLETPWGQQIPYTICGFTGDTSMLTDQEAFGLFLNTETYQQLAQQSNDANAQQLSLFVQFRPYTNIQRSVDAICAAFALDRAQIGENYKLMSLLLQSKDAAMLQLYGTALVLALLVMAASVLMITSSLRSNISQRTEFFGMLRCLGATRQQIIRFVRREALYWCRRAILLGALLSILVVWCLCALLKRLSPSYFATMPTFAISWPAVIAGAVLGLLTVLVAAQTPAKRAATVSPLVAVTGSNQTATSVASAADTQFFSLPVALGFHHAVGNRKSFVLMTASFAFSIILFLSFSVTIDLMQHAIKPLQPYTADFSIESVNGQCDVPCDLAQKLAAESAVKRAFGRGLARGVPIQLANGVGKADIVSYEAQQMNWAKKKLLAGSLQEVEHGNGVLAVFSSTPSLQVGDTVTLGEQMVTVSGLVGDCPVNSENGTVILICSEQNFAILTGQQGYQTIDLQLAPYATDADLARIRAMAGDGVTFSDKRISNQDVRGAYYCFAVFVYGFLTVIALIAVCNIINSIGLSVTARLPQYGVMRAIGMSNRQLMTMIAAEACTYGCCGILLGCMAGLPLHRVIFAKLIAFRWGDAWTLPTATLLLILSLVGFSVILALCGPARRIRRMSVVDTIRGR